MTDDGKLVERARERLTKDAERGHGGNCNICPDETIVQRSDLRTVLAALSPQEDALREALVKTRSQLQQCLDNVAAYAKQTDMSAAEANGREYAWAYAIATIDDTLELAALASKPDAAMTKDEQ